MARHAQITQNNKFAIFLQYLMKVDFLHADKHESLLQIDSMILMGIVKHSQNFQNNKFSMFLQYIQDVKNEIDFLHADKHQSILKNILGIKIFYKVDVIIINGHDQAFSSYSVTSLQYINISKKKLGMEVIFGMQINVKGSTSWYYPF